MVSYIQVLLHRRGVILKREIGRGGAVINKECIGGIESEVQRLSLAELGCLLLTGLLPGKKESVFFLLGSAVIMGQESSTFQPPDSFFFFPEGKIYFIVTLISQIKPSTARNTEQIKQLLQGLVQRREESILSSCAQPGKILLLQKHKAADMPNNPAVDTMVQKYRKSLPNGVCAGPGNRSQETLVPQRSQAQKDPQMTKIVFFKLPVSYLEV